MSEWSDCPIGKRSCSFALYGGQEEFESYMKVSEWIRSTPSVHSKPEFHSFDLEAKTKFLNSQRDAITTFLRSSGGLVQAYNYLTPLYTLLGSDAQRPFQTSYFFTQVFRKYFTSKGVATEVNNLKAFGSVLLDRVQTKITNGRISTLEGIGRLATHETTYICTPCTDGSKTFMALARIRDEKGHLLPGVSIKWLGKSLELIENWSIAFTDLNTLEVVELKDNWNQELVVLDAQNDILEIRNQLNDLMRSAYIAYKYCSMRRQFKTLSEDHKSERRVVEYQVTTHRIVNAITFGFSHLISLDSLRNKFQVVVQGKKPEAYQYGIFIKVFAQRTITRAFELLEVVRETMGGFGFLRFSGLPTLQERALCLYHRYGLDHSNTRELITIFRNHEQNQIFINAVQGMATAAHPSQMLKEVGVIDEKAVENPFSLFGYLAAKLRLAFLESPVEIHAQQAVNQTQNIMNTFIGIQFFYYLAFRRHRLANEYNDKVFVNFVQTELLKIEHSQEIRTHLLRSYPKVHQSLMNGLPMILDSLEFEGTFSDALIGQENEDAFYTQLIDWAKNRNLRNDSEVKKFLLQDVQAYLQRPSL